jgi:cell wall-associated NlpC family hydrolase
MGRYRRFGAASIGAALSLILAIAPIAGATQTTEHTVQPGETLWQIALNAGVDTDTLMRLNGLEDADVLRAGQTLKLHGSAPSSKKYAVAEGDTLSAIALQLNVSASALVEANRLDDPDRLSVGAELVVPGSASGSASAASNTSAPAPSAASNTSAPAPSAASSTSAPAPSAPKPAQPTGKRAIVTSYTVQAGETLGHIARQLDVKASAIAEASGLDDPNRIVVGTVLKVPLPGYEHVVTEGQTLRDIALKAQVDLGSLVDFNDIEDPELIRVGQVVLIPAPATQRVARAEPTPEPKPAATPTPKPASTPEPKPAATQPPKPAATPAPAPKPAPAPPANAPKDGLVGGALKLLGAPYVWGGSSPSGFDCSGFVWYVARQSGKSVSRGLMGQYDSGSHPARNELKVGDLVFFQNTYRPGVSHNGIYLGNDQFVHAAGDGFGVTISNLSSAYWSSHWFGATRLP